MLADTQPQFTRSPHWLVKTIWFGFACNMITTLSAHAVVSTKPEPSTNFPKTLEELSGFEFQEDEILAELGIAFNTQTKKSISTIHSWIRKEIPALEKQKLETECAKKFSGNLRSTKLSQSNFVCAPWLLEQLHAEFLKNKKIPEKTESIVQVSSEAQWQLLSGREFSYTFPRLDAITMQDLEKLVGFAKSTKNDCNFAPAAAGIIARAESFFPDEKAFDAIETVYPQVFQCLNPNDDGFERVHMRVGLIELMKGDTSAARKSLMMASRSEDPQEDFRSLFWLGVLENSSENIHWKQLRQRYPLAIHSVISAHSSGLDPFDKIAATKESPITRRVPSTWTEFNLASFVFELLLARNDSVALNTWSQFISRFVDSPSPESVLYHSWLHSKAQNYRLTISLITRFLREKEGKGISQEVLSLYFPRAFSETIMKNSQELDPVLIFALVRQESAFDAQAKSGADARGLMQLLPSTAKQFVGTAGVRDLYNPATNITAGVSYLQNLLKKYGGRVEDVLASYNAGPRNLDRWRTRYLGASTLLFSDLVPFKETRGYISIIQRNAYWYGRLMDIQNDSLANTIKEKSGLAKWRSETVYNLLDLAWSKNTKKTAQLDTLFKLNSSGN
jgi:soluble lytic murein transglycosylase